MLKLLVVLTVVVCVVHAALLRDTLQPKPEEFEDQQGCFIGDLTAVIPFGQSMPSKKECKEYRCKETLVIQATCNVIGIRSGCIEMVNQTLPFPDCCPRESCPE